MPFMLLPALIAASSVTVLPGRSTALQSDPNSIIVETDDNGGARGGAAQMWGVEYFAAVNRTTSCTAAQWQDPEVCSRPGHSCCFLGELEQVAIAFRVSRVAVEWDIIEGGVCGSAAPALRSKAWGC